MKKHITFILMGVLGLAIGTGICNVAWGEETALLWEIGKADNNDSEFALAPNRYGEYQEDGLYVVGQSDPAVDWPYVHPGPSDTWAKGRPHSFVILFGLTETPKPGMCRLKFDLLDTHSSSPPRLRIRVNNKEFSRDMPAGAGDASISGDPAQGREHTFQLSFPAETLQAGDNEIVISNDRGSWMLYDWIGLETPPGAKLASTVAPVALTGAISCPPVILRNAGNASQLLRIPLRYTGKSTSGVVTISGYQPIQVSLTHGMQMVEAPIPPVEVETPVHIALEIEDNVKAEQDAVLKPVRKWRVYLMHHTHLDIGYTHHQSDVEARQWKHVEKALELIAKTKDYPEGARFKWLPEGLWAMDGYLKQATPEKRQAFIDAVKSGSIGLDALYGNELTALCRPEELIELSGYARRLEREYGVTIDSAMISDVPGYTWGLIPVLAQSGVKYFSIGPNAGHRIGYTLSEWGDKPFYWVSPSGKEKVLCWVAAKAYSWFHSGPITGDAKILDYLAELDAAQFPYDVVPIRYNIGGDNGPPDPNLPDFVKAWNEKYTYPELMFGTTTEAFRDFEQRYGDKLPEFAGDFTPYWEDGAASSSIETAINRAAAERIVQADALWALMRPNAYPADAVKAAWREVILYDEHTWGSHNSISEPECDFTLGQWKTKQAFALDGASQSRALLAGALGKAAGAVAEAGCGAAIQSTGAVSAVQVFNTASWPHTDLVVLPKDWALAGDIVKGPDGAALPSQRLSTGELAFLARDVPPLAAMAYSIEPGAATATGDAEAEGLELKNGLINAVLDEASGAIERLTSGVSGENLVNQDGGLGLNDYLYVAGRDPKEPQRNGAAEITVKEPGPLVASLLVESDAPGCRKLTRELRIIAGMPRLEIFTTIDKEKIYKAEAVHLAFPFNVPGGVTRMDIPFAVVRPDADQLAGSCKNYFTVQRWVDVSNEQFGVTWATPDAPLIEIGKIVNDARLLGWLTETPQPTSTIYSYVMNNYWETNYKAAQEGPTLFRFAIQPHGAYDPISAQRFGIECSQPLIAVPGEAAPGLEKPLFRIVPESVLVTTLKPSDDGKALVVRLFNAGGKAEQVSLSWSNPAPKHLTHSTLDEAKGKEITGPFEMAPWEIVTIRAELH